MSYVRNNVAIQASQLFGFDWLWLSSGGLRLVTILAAASRSHEIYTAILRQQ